MDCGVLETAVILGLIKIVCSALYLPALRDSFNSVGFCCSCLLIFTDILVTVFLTLLWLAKPWQPHSLAPSDVIVSRLLLFLDYTYGSTMVLTAPLIAVDTACRLRWPLESEKWGDRGVGGGRGEFHGGHLNLEREEDQSTGTSCDSEVETNGLGHGQMGSLIHFPGFLCCLLVWSVCGCSGGQDLSSEAWLVEACLQAGGSLSSCLPDLLTVTLRTLESPSRPLATFALCLVLALNMGVLRGGWGQGGPIARTDKRTGDADTPGAPQLAVPASAHSGAKTHGAQASYSSCGVTVHSRAEDGRTSLTALTSAGHRLPTGAELPNDSPQGPYDKRESTPLSCRGAPHGDVMLAIPEIVYVSNAHPPRSPRRLARSAPAVDDRRGGRGPGSLLTGLICGAALCLFPPAIAVNCVLLRSVERLTEWSLRHIVPASD